ncbi:MAG: polysaccharide deacetylase family protein, partial [bacterium]
MTWEQIRELHLDGFEIGNHTKDQSGITDRNSEQLAGQLNGISERCLKFGIPAPTSFAWPGNAISDKALPGLSAAGILFARRGGAPEYP